MHCRTFELASRSCGLYSPRYAFCTIGGAGRQSPSMVVNMYLRGQGGIFGCLGVWRAGNGGACGWRAGRVGQWFLWGGCACACRCVCVVVVGGVRGWEGSEYCAAWPGLKAYIALVQKLKKGADCARALVHEVLNTARCAPAPALLLPHRAQSANVRSSAIFSPLSSITTLSWLMCSCAQQDGRGGAGHARLAKPNFTACATTD